MNLIRRLELPNNYDNQSNIDMESELNKSEMMSEINIGDDKVRLLGS